MMMRKGIYIAIAVLCLTACGEGETDSVSQELTRTAIDSTAVAATDTVKVDTAWSAVNDYDYDGKPIDGLKISTDDIGTGDAADAV